jgi:bacterioferritin-associated ferredoxin
MMTREDPMTRCSHKLWERQAVAQNDCPICLRIALKVISEENMRLREIETELRTVLAHAYSEMALDGVAQNISSAMFAEMRRMLGRRKAED